jgi:hypothetical protein
MGTTARGEIVEYSSSTNWSFGVPLAHGDISTVKAPNFGPHVNFGPLFQKSLVSLKRVLQKNEEN